MIFPTIYKRTSTGATQIWFAEVDGPRYRTTSGQIDGKKTVSEWTVAKPKNVGRSNELSAEEQAIAEVTSKYEHKLARDYREEQENVDVSNRFKPMLATKWVDRKDKIKDKMVYMQPKLDGVRCIANKQGLWSRDGKPIVGAPNIFSQLSYVFELYPDLVLDGELYNHNLKEDFNTIVSAIKKHDPEKEKLLQYWIYDIGDNNKTLSERRVFLQNLFDQYLESAYYSLVLVETSVVTIDAIPDVASDFIENGFEGAMIRLNEKYENKRSKSLIKYKEFQDEEFEIVDFIEGDGNRSGGAASALLKLPDGRTFRAGMIGSWEYCQEILVNKDQYIGKLGTVVFQNYTPDGIPRFGKFKGIRFDV